MRAMEEICDQQRNFARLREETSVAAPPTIPYMGTTLSDLLFTDEGNASVGGKPRVVNWFKVRAIGSLVKEIVTRQTASYGIARDAEAQRALEAAEGITNDEALYALSLSVEAKSDGSEKEARRTEKARKEVERTLRKRR